MRPSTRNQFPGTVASFQVGEATAVVKVALAGGRSVTASITREATDDVALAPASR